MSNGMLGKLMRDLSFKPRFRHNFGCDGEYFDFIVKYKEQWEDKLFYIDEVEMEKQDKTNIPLYELDKVKFPQLDLRPLDLAGLQNEFLFKEDSLTVLLHQGNDTSKHQLKSGETIDLNQRFNRNGLMLNTGGYVTSMEWLVNPKSDSQHYQYLAVSVINNKYGLEDVINNEQLSLFNTKVNTESLKSGIQIWRYDLQSNKMELYKFYLTNNFGCVNNLRWLPISIEDENVLGIISGTLGDGRLHLFKIEKNDKVIPEVANVEKSSVSYFINDSKDSNQVISITSYDFLGNDKIIVGLNNGCIAEFILPIKSGNDEEESDLNDPSFIQRIGDSLISSVMVAKAAEERYILIINTTGVKSVALEYNDFRFSNIEAYPTNTFVKPSYNPSLKMYILSTTIDSVGYNFIKNPQEAPNSLLKINGIVSSFVLSRILGHPLNLIGSSYGDLYIVNSSRKPLNGSKATNKTLVPLRLWQVSLDESNTLKISGDLHIVDSEMPGSLSITPPDIIISSTAWNENPTGSSIYTASIMAGLIILERLDPKFSGR